MRTYTFADKDAPVSAHMAGLVKALELWARAAERDSDQAITTQARERNHGRMLAFKEIIEVIKDSNSID